MKIWLPDAFPRHVILVALYATLCFRKGFLWKRAVGFDDVAMSVYIETSAGDVVVDLFTDECPQACQNFLKLCKYVCCFMLSFSCFLSSAIAHTVLCRLKYYHNCMFFKVTRNFIAQSGDPGNDGSGGTSIFGYVITLSDDLVVSCEQII